MRIIMDWKQNLSMMKQISAGLVFKRNFLIMMWITDR